MLEYFSDLGLRINRYHTKEEPFQTRSKIVKISPSKLHCVACGLLDYWAESDVTLYIWATECSMNLIKLKFCDELFMNCCGQTIRSQDLLESGPGWPESRRYESTMRTQYIRQHKLSSWIYERCHDWLTFNTEADWRHHNVDFSVGITA